jgi:putative sigma-54 modulation protein
MGLLVSGGQAVKSSKFGRASFHKQRSAASLAFALARLHPKYMNLILSTHNVTLTKAIEDHLVSRINKLDHLNRWLTNARVTLEHDHTRAPERQFSCSIKLSVRGPDLFAEDVESDLYAAIDLVVKKIEQQLRKRRNKSKARKHKVAARTKRSRQEAGL